MAIRTGKIYPFGNPFTLSATKIIFDPVNCGVIKVRSRGGRMHYAKKYKMEINRLKRVIDTYYHAIYDLKKSIGLAQGIYGGLPRLEGNEERMPVTDPKEMKELIDALPLIDSGMLIEE